MSMDDRLRAKAYRQAATMYAHWRRSGAAGMDHPAVAALFEEMQIDADWIWLTFALVDIGCNLAGLDPVQASMYLDRVMREAMIDEATGDD